MLLSFPTFSLYSTSLLVLVTVGYLCATVLLVRFVKEKQLSDLFLALLLIATGFHRSSYIIGFMSWYDTFRQTKINYLLIDITFAFGPLLYFYVRSLTQARFKFSKSAALHFVPIAIFILYNLVIWMYDSVQPGYAATQNGVLKLIFMKYVDPFVTVFGYFSQVLYYAFAIQVYLLYQKRIRRYFSNTQKIELRWIRNFLLVYFSLFVFQVCIDTVNSFIDSLHWKTKWWGHIAGGLVMLYVGLHAYYLNLKQFREETAEVKTEEELFAEEDESSGEIQQWKQKLITFMNQEMPYLDPELSLSQLAQKLRTNSNHLSQIINAGFGRNFKDFINEYRVEAVKETLSNDEKKHLTLLGIAHDCGFNSKATFNRTFKKFTQQTPSEFMASQNPI